MNEILEEFKIVFGFDDKPLQDGIKKTQNSLAGLGKVFGSLMASYVSFQSLKAIIVDYTDFNVELGKSTSLLGLNVEEVSALGGALERFGGNTDSAVSSIKSLSGHLEQAKQGQGALIEVSRKYGLRVNPFASATDTLKSLGSQMGRFTNQQRLAISQQLGLDESLTRAFADGGVELERQIERQKKWGTATDEDIEISKAFNNAQLDLKDIFGALTRDFARVILPAFTKLVELFSSFIEWVRNHKQLVIIFFTGILIAMSPILIMLGKIAFASLKAFAPFFIIGAVIAGVSLIIEDIYGYFMGWDSVTGDLVKKFPVIGMLLEPLRPIVKGIADTFEAIVNWLKDPSLETWAKVWDGIKNTIGEIVIMVTMMIYDGIGKIGDLFVWLGEQIYKYFKNPISDAIDSFKSFFGFGSEIQASQTIIPQAPAVPYQASTMNNQANNYNVNNNFNQNISTATPTQFANQTNAQIADSIYNIRQQNGAL